MMGQGRKSQQNQCASFLATPNKALKLLAFVLIA
jgi:hypothetical protein